jgi:hypothetical protein
MKTFSQHILQEDPDYYEGKRIQGIVNNALKNHFYSGRGVSTEDTDLYDQFRRNPKESDVSGFYRIVEPHFSEEGLPKNIEQHVREGMLGVLGSPGFMHNS